MKKIFTLKTNFFIVITLLLINNGYSQCFVTLTNKYNHNIGIKTNGTLWGWGWGDWGQLSNTTDFNEPSPIQIGTSNNWQFAVAGYYNAFSIKTDGSLWGTGRNDFGQLGIGNANIVENLTQIGTATNWKQIAPADSFTIGLRLDGSLWGWGFNDYYQVGDGTLTTRYSPVQLGTATDWKMIASCAARQGFALKNNGTLWGWGSNLTGMLGDSTVQTVPVPTQLNTDTDWKSITLGYAHILAIKNNGTLWSWGGGDNGECGDNLPLFYFRDTPQQVGTDTWKVVAGGYFFSFGIKNNGTLWAWGKNDVGQLGDGTTTNQAHPVQIGTDTNWSTVAAGYQHVVALKTNGAIYTWGNNISGQLGNGTTTNTTTPAAITITGCALANDGFSKENNSFTISPNPAKSELNLNYNGNEVINTIIIYDITGKEVFKTQPVTTTTLMATFSIAELQSGSYLVVLKNNDKTVVSKQLVKE